MKNIIGWYYTVLIPKNGWNSILSMKEKASSTNKLQLRKELLDYKYRDGQTIAEYLSGLNVIITKLKAVESATEDEDIIAKVLSALHRKFELFKDLYQMYMDENKERSLKDFLKKLNIKEESQNSKETSGKGDAFLSIKKNLTCTLCKKRGHKKSDCWSKRESSKTEETRE